MSQLERDDGTVIAAQVELATGLWSRFVGLMGRSDLPRGHALYIRPCNSIHMFFMRFAIDAAFLDGEGRVLRVYDTLRPWRMTRIVPRSKAVAELPAGTLREHGITAGDRLRVTDAAGG